jgi:hypothetical protein
MPWTAWHSTWFAAPNRQPGGGNEHDVSIAHQLAEMRGVLFGSLSAGVRRAACAQSMSQTFASVSAETHQLFHWTICSSGIRSAG